MKSDDLRYLAFARNVSNHSQHRQRVGAVLLRKGTPISVGFNKKKCPNRRFITGFNTTHAEIAALASSGKNQIKKSVIYVYRQDKHGNPKLARPCKFCQKELIKFGVRTMYYSIGEPPYWAVESL